jgi:hypothetical protein
MFTLVHIIVCLIAFGFCFQGIDLIRNRTWTFNRRKHSIGGLEEVREVGNHLIPVGIAYIVMSLFILLSAISKINSQNENLFEYLATLLISGAILLGGAVIADIMKRNQR